MRAFSTLELLVCIAIISLLISMTFFFRWDDTKKELEENATGTDPYEEASIIYSEWYAIDEANAANDEYRRWHK